MFHNTRGEKAFKFFSSNGSRITGFPRNSTAINWAHQITKFLLDGLESYLSIYLNSFFKLYPEVIQHNHDD